MTIWCVYLNRADTRCLNLLRSQPVNCSRVILPEAGRQDQSTSRVAQESTLPRGQLTTSPTQRRPIRADRGGLPDTQSGPAHGSREFRGLILPRSRCPVSSTGGQVPPARVLSVSRQVPCEFRVLSCAC